MKKRKQPGGFLAWAVLFDGKMWYILRSTQNMPRQRTRGFMNKEKHIIAGGGAAGMIAAVATAAREGYESLYEK